MEQIDEIDLREYIFIIRKRIWIILLITVVSVAASGLVSFYVLESVYETHTTMMVGKTKQEQMIEYNDVLLSQKLVKTYGEIARSRIVSKEVIENLNLEYTPEQLKNKVSVSPVKDTEIIMISVQDSDPAKAAEIANNVALVFIKHVVAIMNVDNVQVIDKAEIPQNAIKPREMLNMAIAGLLGLMLSFGIVFLLEYLDNTIKSPGDVEKYLELPTIGTIPEINEKDHSHKIIAMDNPKSPIAEAYRTLRTNLQFSSLDKEMRSIVVTSTGPGEGKTTTICNLAVTMAQSGIKVLLIDCDLRKSQVHKHFELSNNRGITNVLARHASFEEAVKRTQTMGLDILTAGPKPPNPAELVGSNVMKEFIREMTKEYDRVLIDAPPVGVVTDAALLSTIVDGTILVVASGQVNIDATQRSKSLLQKVNANILGGLLNKIQVDGKGYYGYYYYDYYEDDHVSASKRKRRK